MGSTGSPASGMAGRAAAGTAAASGQARHTGLAGWLTSEIRWTGRLRIRPLDVVLTAAVVAAVELEAAVGGGAGAARLDTLAWVLGALIALPVLLRHRWPVQVLIACTILLMAYYTFHRRNISPAPLLSVPLYDAAVAGYLTLAIVIPAAYMAVGLFVVEISTHVSVLSLVNEFLPSIVVLMLAIMLGEVVRGRRALAAETAQRLRAAREEREAEAARRVAEERLRIARDLHDTVAHSMATITVQAGSALHLLEGRDTALRAALTAIRETSKHALGEMRSTLGQLRAGGPAGGPAAPAGGLDRLPGLRDAVSAAGVPVTVTVAGSQRPLPPDVDQAAYRIIQEALTNVLRHGGPAAHATVRLHYQAAAVTIRVTDDGAGAAGGNTPATAGGAGGHGLTGMAERAAAVGGEVTAGPLASGGFEVAAWLPLPATGTTAAAAAPAGSLAADHPCPDGLSRDDLSPDDLSPDGLSPDGGS